MDADSIYRRWMENPAIDEKTKEELRSIEGNEAEIEDRFYKELEFGTAGLRGIIGAGTNRMNIYTVAKAARGLADYINSCTGGERGVAIAYDSRHMSEEFAGVSAGVLNAAGIKAYVFDSLRPTPELSFTIRHLGCIAGINITASHNPPEYNGYKVYWEDGAQVTEPHDDGITECVNSITDITGIPVMPRGQAEGEGLYIEIGKEIDDAYEAEIIGCILEDEVIEEVAGQVKIVYTPLHGTGIEIVPGALEKAGFRNVYIVKEQQVPDGDFPTVEYPNPEAEQAFELADALAREVEADIVLATDPDADRIGVHVRDQDGNYHALTGNQIGSMLCEYELTAHIARGGLPEDGYIIRSIVSGAMVDAIAESYGVECVKVLTGFKYIGRTILEREEAGEGTFLFGFEESYGYLTGTYARDKDACAAALVLCEMCAYFKSFGLSLWEALQVLYDKYGVYKEKTISITKSGIDGLREIQSDMDNLRKNPPEAFGEFPVVDITDYEDAERTGLPSSNVLMYQLIDGWVAVRPSGTEPKIKYYIGVRGSDEAEAQEMLDKLSAEISKLS